eukprot:1338829-Alexandrium_andersonii.AAC.1
MCIRDRQHGPGESCGHDTLSSNTPQCVGNGKPGGSSQQLSCGPAMCGSAGPVVGDIAVSGAGGLCDAAALPA